MELQKEEWGVLRDLGLRITEAKVYLKLIEQGTVNVSVISKVTAVGGTSWRISELVIISSIF